MKSSLYYCFLVLLLFTCKSKEASTQKEKTETRPNIIIVLADDLGWKDLGCYGNTFIETPRLDEFAKTSVQFTRAYAAAPVCSPTRASLMTGKCPAQLKLTNYLYGTAQPDNEPVLVPDYAKQLPLEEITLAEILKSLGYSTGMVGKWHLATGDEPSIYEPKYQGFDFQDGGRGSAAQYFYPDWLKSKRTNMIAGDTGKYITDEITDHGLRWVSSVKDRPFFLYMAHYSVHIPLMAKKDLQKKYETKRELLNDTLFHPEYAAMVENLDQNFGKVLDSLKKWGIEENTILVFLSDNGGLVVPEGGKRPTTCHPLREGKGSLYEGGIRIPMILSYPKKGINKIGKYEGLVSTIDLLPTLCDWAGKNPAELPKGVDGISLTSLLLKNEKNENRELYWHYPHFSNQHLRPGGAVMKGPWKLIENYRDGSTELYNLNEDISELSDIGKESQNAMREELHQKLKSWRKKQNAQLMKKNPKFDFSNFKGSPVVEE